MATVRISPTKIDIDGIIYTFASVEDADAFEACIATADVTFCSSKHPPLSQSPADTNLQDMAP